MSFLDLVRTRYSVRQYLLNEIEKEKLDRILEAARLAPTAANKQAFKIIVAHTRGKEEVLKTTYKRDWFIQAPIVLCVCSIPSQAWVRRYDNKNHADVDAAIIADHLIMAATDEGLGTCWICAFDTLAARKAFNIPDNAEPVVLITLGYAADQPTEKNGKT